MPTVDTAWSGIKIQYDQTANTFFEIIAKEALGLIASKPVGLRLLNEIGKQAPAVNTGLPPGCNVLIMPTPERKFYDNSSKQRAPKDARVMVPSGLSGSCNAAVDATATDRDGSACKLYFNNTITMTSKGESTWSFIVLAHEMIHSLHCLKGQAKNGQEEEDCTVGLGSYSNEAITENKIRGEHGLPVRLQYR